MATCAVCGKAAETRTIGLCHTHAARWRRWGRPTLAEWTAAFREGRLCTCAICGGDYNGYKGSAICSPACDAERRRRDALARYHAMGPDRRREAVERAKARSRRRTAAAKVDKVCPICGARFRGFAHRVYDRPECRAEAGRRANAAIRARIQAIRSLDDDLKLGAGP